MIPAMWSLLLPCAGAWHAALMRQIKHSVVKLLRSTLLEIFGMETLFPMTGCIVFRGSVFLDQDVIEQDKLAPVLQQPYAVPFGVAEQFPAGAFST